MDTIARLIWNPFLCLLYIEVGVIFAIFIRSLAWKKSLHIFFEIFKNDRSKYTDKLVSHTKAFLSTIAATVGIGNLAGVGTAIHLGGPGALFWMWVSAFFGMFFKLTSTYFAVKYRPADKSSLSFATPMVYLEKHMKGIWKFVPRLVAGLIVIQGVVLYNLVQANSLAHGLHNRFAIPNWTIALVLTILVSLVILGGLKRIVDFTSAIAPVIILLYVLAGLIILLSHPMQTMKIITLVFYHAFNPCAITGGVIGYTVRESMQFGVSRGIFSHMSGLGASTFLQGANEDPPAMGAFMSAITPFVDTIIVCTITGLVILSAPFWQDKTGAYLTLKSFEFGLGSIGRLTVIISLTVFAFTTITGFAHFSEKCYKYLGGNNVLAFRIVFLAITFIGPFLNLKFVWSLSDIIIAMLLFFHLIPLLTILISNFRVMLKDLNDFTY